MTEPKDDTAGFSGAYALHALNDEEAKAFEAHMRDSEETRHEVTELTDTAVLLGLATDPVEPPASLKLSIMAQLDSFPQLPRETAQQAETAPEAELAPTQFDGPAESKARARWFTRPVNAVIGVAAAVALIVGGGVIAGMIGNNPSNEAAADQLAAIYAADDSQRAVTTIEGGGSATLVWSSEMHKSALIVDGLEAAPSGKTYQLWYIDDAGARPAGILSASDSGSMWRVLDGDMASGDAVGVTVEPAGGSTVPSSDPVITIKSA